MSTPHPGARPEVVVPQSRLDSANAKARLRRQVREARARRSATELMLADTARTRLALSAIGEAVGPNGCVACYLSTRDEPDTLALVDHLRAAGVRVLVPLLVGRRSPAFGEHTGLTAPGRFDIPEPIQPTGEPANEVALSEADLIICPALLATRDGRRLGMGAGWYDRVLPQRRPGVPVWVLLHGDEVVDDLPVAPHDQLVDAILTEDGLIRVIR